MNPEPCCREVRLHKDWTTTIYCECPAWVIPSCEWYTEFATDEDDEDYYVAWECGRVVMGDGSLKHEFKNHSYERYYESVYLCEKCKNAWMLKDGYWAEFVKNLDEVVA